MKIQYLIHADFELPGIIETWAESKQFKQNICRPFDGEKLPKVGQFDFLIVMGGPQSPLELEKDPYLRDEIMLIKQAIHNEIPILGFCLGAQLIGEALGGKTEKSPYKEVGVFPIELTKEGQNDLILKGLPYKFPVVHWHNDMPGLTQDAKILAFSEGCPRQIVRYTPFVYGFQCHPEPMKKNIEAMIFHCPNDFTNGKFVQSPDKLLASDFDSINRIMVQMMDNMLNAVGLIPTLQAGL